MKKTDALKEFAALKEALAAEKADLEARLEEINEALGQSTDSAAPLRRAATGQRGYGSNTASLKATVIEVLKGKSLNRQEILDAVLKAGYKFKAKDPLNSLGTTLYTSKEFKAVERGVFSLA